MTIGEDTAVTLARLEANLEGIKNQIDHSERTSQQFAKLVEERFTIRFDGLDRRLSEIDAARERARKDDMHAREALQLKQTALELRVTALEKFDLTAVERDVEALKDFKTKLVGICIGASTAAGGITAAIFNALGGTS